ncbi:hypothetical protein TCAL_15303 [Tigriopus californicus]|uniref:Uncharacterized protein n=2 Tax=Tigriopus californicus TaxID=6832 RepID=A0A553PMG7_TIGCA|nr:hypothetical protein TCAL_15303 [Tigriopus californicus]
MRTNLQLSRHTMKSFLILTALLGLSLAAPDHHTEMDHAPEYNVMIQDKIVELYEFLKAELEGEGDMMEAIDPIESKEDDEDLVNVEDEPVGTASEVRNKRSADPFFLRKLFRGLRRGGFRRRSYNRGFGRRYNRGRSYGRKRYYG